MRRPRPGGSGAELEIGNENGGFGDREPVEAAGERQVRPARPRQGARKRRLPARTRAEQGLQLGRTEHGENLIY